MRIGCFIAYTNVFYVEMASYCVEITFGDIVRGAIWQFYHLVILPFGD